MADARLKTTMEKKPLDLLAAMHQPAANSHDCGNGTDHAPDARRNGVDGRLVQRCLAGEAEAWDLLFRQAHPILLESARYLLGPNRRDDDLVEEIASRVWYALLRDNHRVLARYDAAENHLGAYLFGVAKREIQQFWRAQRRRLTHESQGGQRNSSCDHAAELEASALLQEFLAQLNAGEQEFLAGFLLPARTPPAEPLPPSPSGNGRHNGNATAQHLATGNGLASEDGKLSKSGVRQRSRRLRLKLEAFLDQHG